MLDSIPRRVLAGVLRRCYVWRMNMTKLAEVFHSDPEILGGTPVFTGTRVPVQNLVDYLEGGETIDEFLAGFPTVKREQVIRFIEAATEKLLAAA